MYSSGLPFPRSKKTTPSPQPQPSDDDCTDSYSSGEDEEEEIPSPLPPPQSEQHDEDTEESSDDENAEEDQDQDPDPVTKPKQESQTPAAALTVAAPALDGVRHFVKGGANDEVVDVDRLEWENETVNLVMQHIGWSEEFSRAKIKSLAESERNLMVQNWKKLKMDQVACFVNRISLQAETMATIFGRP